ncbi:Coatomer, epsilon subunit [Carpediemonas membranifera]|uniref:Coatomer, epsilon subunit n=1 Tax=Carpediemonas membranifera TaxID=201153 RepID=A0A8J6BAU9_9EUKA|nr:Coatomer, epsilon subunit [Carpediemonas membranifera]|eukprot:KAG9396392.1 Coatomer, epsilon subunit [Carpediemonas membranifera]
MSEDNRELEIARVQIKNKDYTGAWNTIASLSDASAFDLRIQICIHLNQFAMASEVFEKMKQKYANEPLTTVAAIRDSFLTVSSTADYAAIADTIDSDISRLRRWDGSGDLIQQLTSYKAAALIGQGLYEEAIDLLADPFENMTEDDLANLIVCYSHVGNSVEMERAVAHLKKTAPSHQIIRNLAALSDCQ